jgi:hypothetical protein
VSGARCAPALAAVMAAALVTPGPAHADPALYVVEQLVVNVNSAAGGTGEHVATLKSGDRVELIEKAGDEAHVRLANGRDGWVRASYLMTTEPLRVQLAARTAEVAQLQGEIEKLQAAVRAGPAAPIATAAASTPSAAAGAPDNARPPGAMLAAAPVIYRPRWRWVATSAAISLAVGFALGWWALDRRVRARYGGLRIY